MSGRNLSRWTRCAGRPDNVENFSVEGTRAQQERKAVRTDSGIAGHSHKMAARAGPGSLDMMAAILVTLSRGGTQALGLHGTFMGAVDQCPV